MIDDSGILKIDLYHGTSSIFLTSIKKEGLGGINVLKKYNIESLFQNICEIFSEHFSESEWWANNDYIYNAMLNDKVTNSGMNFRYGSVYLTPSKYTATNYAKLNYYGSEYLSYFLLAYEALKEISEDSALKAFPYSHALRSILVSEPSPIVLTISNVLASSLRTEQGNDISEQLDFLKNNEEIMWQQFNFETTEIINFENILFEYIEKV